MQIADAKKGQHKIKDITDATVSSLAQQQQQQQSIPGAIQLSAKELPSGYRWIDTTNGGINPTMNFNLAVKTIQLLNPTDSKHQLVIDDSNGNQLATSGDIVSGGSSQFSFKPVTTGIFEYHCIYHPTTMRGIVQVTDGS